MLLTLCFAVSGEKVLENKIFFVNLGFFNLVLKKTLTPGISKTRHRDFG